MNTERTVVIENVSDILISLGDTQNRKYLLKGGAKMRISAASLQDILDAPASKNVFDREYVKIGNISTNELYAMGLNEDEINKYLLEDSKPAVVITPAIEEEPVEIIEIEEPVVENEEDTVIEEKPVVKKPAAKKTTKKNTNKGK